MIVLNTTFHIHSTIERQFIEWIRNEYIPAAKSAGIFTVPECLHILIKHDPDAESYAVQMRAESKSAAEHWHDNEGAVLRSKMARLYGERILFFTTYMDLLSI